MIRTLTLLGRRWRYIECRMDDRGKCDPPDKADKAIRINRKLTGEEKLDTQLHEIFHALAWHVDEEYVEQAATEVARALYRLGYREQD